MQDEVRDKSVALAIKVGKTGGRLTADLLKWAIRKYLAQSQNPKIHHGKQSVKQLVGQGTGVKSIDITAKNIKSFESVSSQVKRAKFRHKVYQFWGGVSPQSIPAEKLVSNGLVVLEPVAGAGHVNNLAAVDEAVEDSGGNGGVAEEVGPLVKALVGSNDQ